MSAMRRIERMSPAKFARENNRKRSRRVFAEQHHYDHHDDGKFARPKRDCVHAPIIPEREGRKKKKAGASLFVLAPAALRKCYAVAASFSSTPILIFTPIASKILAARSRVMP